MKLSEKEKKWQIKQEKYLETLTDKETTGGKKKDRSVKCLELTTIGHTAFI